MNVYERIDSILKERHMSRRKLAELAGIPPTSLQSAFSREVDDISALMLRKIAAILGVTTDYLLGGTVSKTLTEKQEGELFLEGFNSVSSSESTGGQYEKISVDDRFPESKPGDIRVPDVFKRYKSGEAIHINALPPDEREELELYLKIVNLPPKVRKNAKEYLELLNKQHKQREGEPDAN